MIKAEAEKLPLFFIIGRPRSGTTLLATLFDAHPHAIFPYECPFILELYPRYGRKKFWTAEDLEIFYEELFQVRFIGMWPLDREHLRADLQTCAGPCTFGTVVKVVISNFRSVHPKKDILLLGDKNPLYSFHFRKIFRNFPEAKYIHLSRDYRDLGVSNQKASFGISVPFVAFNWRKSFVRMDPYEKNFPGQFLRIRYEDLVNDPATHLKQMCAFLGLDYDPTVLDFHKRKEDYKGSYDSALLGGLHSSLLKPITNKSAGVWKTQLKDNLVRMCDMIVGKQAELHGYERKYAGFDLKVFISLVPAWLYWRLLLMGSGIMRALPFSYRRKIKARKPPLSGFFRRLYGEKKKGKRLVAEYNKQRSHDTE